MRELRPYQESFAHEIARGVQSYKHVVAQLSTGGGKTVTFANITGRFIEKSGKGVLIVVHREELISQASRTLYDWYGIIAERVTKGMRKSECYIAMVETLNNKLKKEPKYFDDVGLVVIDEAHVGNHLKILEPFRDRFIIGFTATPISARKRDPLKNHFKEIVCGATIGELIQHGALVKNCTYHVAGSVKRSSLKISKGEFDEKAMGQEFSKAHNVENTLAAYMKHALGMKTVIFNCTIEHSQKVNDLFLQHGLNSRHLDSNCTADERREILDWFAKTPDAILNNVNILTAGFDEPSIECVVVNRSTTSESLWIQAVGRGARTYPLKKYFIVLDLGGNAVEFGDWDDPRDWREKFHFPSKPKDGVAPTKECPECFALCHASAKVCKGITIKGDECGYIYPVKVKVEIPAQLIVFSQNIDVQEVIDKSTSAAEYYPFFRIPTMIAGAAKRHFKEMSNEIFDELMGNVHIKCKEWCRLLEKRYNDWHKERAKETFTKELQKHFPKWEPNQQPA